MHSSVPTASLTVTTTLSPLPLDVTVTASVQPVAGADRLVFVGTAITYCTVMVSIGFNSVGLEFHAAVICIVLELVFTADAAVSVGTAGLPYE